MRVKFNCCLFTSVCKRFLHFSALFNIVPFSPFVGGAISDKKNDEIQRKGMFLRNLSSETKVVISIIIIVILVMVGL